MDNRLPVPNHPPEPQAQAPLSTSIPGGQALPDRAERIAQKFRQEVAQNNDGSLKLMRPPKPSTSYIHQTFQLTLYRRLEGQSPDGYSHKRVDFPDGSGYILMEGSNMDVAETAIWLQNNRENWDIRLKGEEPYNPPPQGPAFKRQK